MVVLTKNNFVYESLRDDIAYGKLRPGERLVISDIAVKYEVSPMPVREAMRRLQQDGFVKLIPHIGARVIEMNLQDFREILLIRQELEPLACRLAAPYMNEEVLTRCDELICTMENYLAPEDFRHFSELDKQLHMEVYCAGPNTILPGMIRNLWDRSAYSRNVFRVNSGRNKVSHHEHILWIQALRDRDEEKAVQILDFQKKSQYAAYLSYIEKNEL